MAPVRGFDPLFCSPEQQESMAVSPATDLWSWALTVIFAVTGDTSWHRKGTAPELTSANLPPALAGILGPIFQPCLNLNPDQRPTCDALERQLRPLYHKITGVAYEAPATDLLPPTTPSAAELYLDEELLTLLRQFQSSANTEAYVLVNKAARLMEASSLDEASKCLRKASELLLEKSANRSLRRWTVQVAAALVQVAQVYDNLGRSEDAEQNLAQAIDILERLVGETERHEASLRSIAESVWSQEACSHSLPMSRPVRAQKARSTRKASESPQASYLEDRSILYQPERLLPHLRNMLADIRRQR
jgi:tetratricopeptide (TPR) repeat protein